MKYFLSLMILFSLVIFMGCLNKTEPEPEPNPRQIRARALDGTWGNTTNIVVPQDIDISIVSGLSITFGINDDTQLDTSSAFGAVLIFDTDTGSGWSFGNSIDLIVFSGVIPVTSFIIVNLTEDILEIQFDHPGGDGYAGKDGTYSMTLNRLPG